MSVTSSTQQTVATQRNRRPNVAADRGSSHVKPHSLRLALGAAVGVGVVSFLATEFMHYLLVPDLGRSHERFLAEGFSALIVSCLILKLALITGEQHRLTVARMQVIAEMNHHIRNALTPISLSAYASEDQQLIRAISEGVERIDWALREILPREIPLRAEQRDRLGYFQHRGSDSNE
jgi:hypothetical protein